MARIPLLVAVLAAIAATAQTPVPPPSQPQQQTFRAATVVVEVDAIVTNGKGQFVTGLTAADFDVEEDGKPQRIQRVYIVDGNTVTVASEPPGSSEPASPPLAPVPSAPPQRVFVLVFDQEHLQEGAFKRLQEAALTFLRDEFKQGDVGGIVIGNTMAGNRLTTDREALVTAVKNAKPSASKTSRRLDLLESPRFNSEAEAIRIALANDPELLEQVARRACQDDPAFCRIDPRPVIMGKARSIVGDLRPAAARTVRSLQALAAGLSRLPGRKTVILITEGFFVEESWADLRQIVGAAARANVRIYSLDARGLDTRQTNDIRQANVMDPGGSSPLEAYNSSEDGPNALAMDTGGYPIRHTNKFAEALAEIARDTSRYYVIGYSPTNGSMDGGFRKISVRVKRPGLRVRARRGYLAVPPTSTASPSNPPSAVGASSPAAPSAPPDDSPPASSASSTPAPTVAPRDNAPASEAGNTAAPTSAPTHLKEAPGFTFRPDSNRVRELASRDESAPVDTNVASQGWDRYQKGDLEGAAELLGKAAADPNARPWVHYALGYSQLALRHPDHAAAEWEKVLAAAPEFKPVYLDLADAYIQIDNPSRAIAVLKSAHARWPEDADILNATGTIQVRRGALEDAINTFKKAAAAKPDEALAYFNLGRTYELRYFKTRRYSRTEARWLANASDLKQAVASYEQYLKIGGPYESQARQAIQNLQWMK